MKSCLRRQPLTYRWSVDWKTLSVCNRKSIGETPSRREESWWSTWSFRLNRAEARRRTESNRRESRRERSYDWHRTDSSFSCWYETPARDISSSWHCVRQSRRLAIPCECIDSADGHSAVDDEREVRRMDVTTIEFPACNSVYLIETNAIDERARCRSRRLPKGK